MAHEHISVDPEQVTRTTAKITAHIEALPSKESLQHVEGTQVGVTSQFHATLVGGTAELASFVDTLTKKLQESHDAILATVSELSQHDQSIKDDAMALGASVEQIGAAAPSATPTPTAPNSKAGKA